jgi:hypothetical protein
MPSSMSSKGSAPASIRDATLPRRLPPVHVGGDPGLAKDQFTKSSLIVSRAGFILNGMPEPVYEFSRHICALCATRGTDVFRLGTRLGIDPMELLRMINGKVVPTKAVISGLAKELDSNVSLLTKLAAEIKP